MSGSDAEWPAAPGRTVRRRLPGVRPAAVLATLTAALAVRGCGGSRGGSRPNDGVNAGAPVNGGTLTAAIPDNPDHLDSGLSYATEGWELLEATGDGLLTFKRTSGAAGAQIVPDIATRMPAVTDGGRTYTFHLHTDVHFSPPVNRTVQPTDIKYDLVALPASRMHGAVEGDADSPRFRHRSQYSPGREVHATRFRARLCA
jgi:ABC-type transport system substrate-binding protein